MTGMKKLLQINPVVRCNTSTGKIMRELGEMAIASGWESYIAYSKARDGAPEHSSHLVPVGNKADLAMHAAATRIMDAHGLASKQATKRFIQRIWEIDPDIIHIHNIHGYFLNYPLLCSFLAGWKKPVIWTAHDCWLFTGHCYHYAAVGCMKWKTGCYDCPQKKAFPASWVFDRSRNNYLDKKKAFTGTLQVSPLALRVLYVHADDLVTNYGIEAGKNQNTTFGPSITLNTTWQIWVSILGAVIGGLCWRVILYDTALTVFAIFLH